MSKQNYTLTGKASVHGEDYHYSKGDVISADEFAALSKRHQSYFESGEIDVKSQKGSFDANPIENASSLATENEQLKATNAELTAQVEQLQATVEALSAGTDVTAKAADTKTESKPKSK